MAGKEQSKTLTLALGKRKPPESNGDEEEEDDEKKIEELEREVKLIAEKIIESRRTIPDRLMEAFSSHLIAQRPLLVFPLFGSSSNPAARPGISADPSTEMRENFELSEEASPTEADEGMVEELEIFRAKIASTIAAMPVILKRMNECIARINKVEQYNVNLHYVFRKKKK